MGPAWTVDLLNSPMALDPVVGFQLLRCFECFLNIRRQAMPRLTAAVGPTGESQDEYGDFDFDYNDPALAAILGEAVDIPPSAHDTAAKVDLKALDRTFAELLREQLSPAIYRLLSNINVVSLGQDTGVPDIPDRDVYVASLVGIWSEMAAVTVENNLRDWSFYM